MLKLILFFVVLCCFIGCSSPVAVEPNDITAEVVTVSHMANLAINEAHYYSNDAVCTGNTIVINFDTGSIRIETVMNPYFEVGTVKADVVFQSGLNCDPYGILMITQINSTISGGISFKIDGKNCTCKFDNIKID